MITSGRNRSGAIDRDGGRITVGEVRCAHGEGACGGAHDTTASTDGLDQQAVATKARREHISAQVELNGAAIKVETVDGTGSGVGRGQRCIATTTTDGLGEQSRGEIACGGEVSGDGQVQSAGLVLTGFFATEHDGCSGGVF